MILSELNDKVLESWNDNFLLEFKNRVEHQIIYKSNEMINFKNNKNKKKC